MGLFTKDIGIDLGTANTLVHVKGEGIVIREPSVVAIDRGTRKVIAVGDEAKEMLGRTPRSIAVIRPLRDGVIADFDVALAMLRYFIERVGAARMGFRPRVVTCVSSGATDVERRAIEEAALQAGARESYLIEEPIAAAIGAGLPVYTHAGSMVVDIGGGSSEVAALAMGGIVACRSIRVAGDAFDASIISYIRREHRVEIGARTAEDIKASIGSAYPRPRDGLFEIRGRDIVDGMPKQFEVTTSQIVEALREPLRATVEAVRATVEKTPPELLVNIVRQGIAITGGSALLFGIDRLISASVGIPAFVADRPLDCVALGTGAALEDIGALRRAMR
jgi:rod shape-determining protein MreB